MSSVPAGRSKIHRSSVKMSNRVKLLLLRGHGIKISVGEWHHTEEQEGSSQMVNRLEFVPARSVIGGGTSGTGPGVNGQG